MDINDLGWERNASEYVTGDYWFNGKFFVTHEVQKTLSDLEIALIYADIQNLVGQKGGQDYLHVYVQKEKDLKLFFIDQVTKESLQLGEQPPEHNYCTLLFAHEY